MGIVRLVGVRRHPAHQRGVGGAQAKLGAGYAGWPFTQRLGVA